MSSPQTTTDLEGVANAIRDHDRFLLVTHENPDGDALGSILAMKLALDRLGEDAVMYLYGDAPLPREYAFMPLAELRRRLPEDWRERVLIALDCANETRIGPDPEPLSGAAAVEWSRSPRQPSRQHGRAGRLRDRSQVRRGRPPAGGGIFERRDDRRDHAVPRARVRRSIGRRR